MDKSKSFYLIQQGQLVSQFGNICFLTTTTLWLTFSDVPSNYIVWLRIIPFVAVSFFGPMVGTLSDYFEKKNLLVAVDLLGAISSILLAFLFFKESSLNTLIMSSLLIISFFQSVFGIFYFVLQEGLMKEMFPGPNLNIRSRVVLFQRGLQILGPTLAAWILQFGPILMLVIDGATYIYGAMSTIIATKEINRRQETCSHQKKDRGEFFKGTLMGLRYLMTQHKLLSLVVISIFVNLFTANFNFVISYFIKDQLGMKLINYPLFMLPGTLAGIYISNLDFINKNNIKQEGIIIYLSIILMSLTYGILFLSKNWIWTAFAITFFSIASVIYNLFIMNYIQQRTSSEFIGRIFSIVLMFSNLMSPVSIVMANYLVKVRKNFNDVFLISSLGLLLLVGVLILINKFRLIKSEIITNAEISLSLAHCKRGRGAAGDSGVGAVEGLKKFIPNENPNPIK